MLHLIDFMCHTRAFQCYQQAGQWTFTGKILSEMVPPPTPLALWPGWMSAFLRLSQSASKLFSSHFSSSWLSSDSMWGSSVFNTLLYSSVGRKVALGIMDPAWAPFRTHHRILHSFCYEPPAPTPGHWWGTASLPRGSAPLLASLNSLVPPAWQESASTHLRGQSRITKAILSLLAGASCTKPESTFQFVMAIFPTPDN